MNMASIIVYACMFLGIFFAMTIPFWPARKLKIKNPRQIKPPILPKNMLSKADKEFAEEMISVGFAFGKMLNVETSNEVDLGKYIESKEKDKPLVTKSTSDLRVSLAEKVLDAWQLKTANQISKVKDWEIALFIQTRLRHEGFYDANILGNYFYSASLKAQIGIAEVRQHMHIAAAVRSPLDYYQVIDRRDPHEVDYPQIGTEHQVNTEAK